ncbi:hypothetical protein J6590_106251 [Homalodisca vitripennis]|nr:hypothetical protein J6590_106251 [Homalodisca vitripennis]
MAGDSLTLADYSYITYMDVLEVYCPAGNRLPLTKQWQERCKSTMKDFDKSHTLPHDDVDTAKVGWYIVLQWIPNHVGVERVGGITKNTTTLQEPTCPQSYTSTKCAIHTAI